LITIGSDRMVAVEVADGHTRWIRTGEGQQPAISGTRLYSAVNSCHDLSVYERDLGTPVFAVRHPPCLAGARTFSTLSGGWLWGAGMRFDTTAFATKDSYDGQAAAYAGGLRVRAAIHPDELQAFDQATGDLRWRVPGPSASVPVVVGDTVAAVSPAGEVSLHDLETGVERWSDALLPAGAGELVAGQGMLFATTDTYYVGQPVALVALGAPGPDTAIRVRPEDSVPSGSAAFVFASRDGGGSYECELDDGPWLPCAAAHTVTGLDDGLHALRVRARTGVEVDRTPALARWRVDRSAASSTVTDGPAGRVASSSATFGFEVGEHPRRIECRLDAGPWERCNPPVAYARLENGEHTFAVRVADLAGNTEDPPATRTWTVDTRAPEAAIASGPDGESRETEARFEFDADEPGSGFECAIDDSQWEPCASPIRYDQLAHGEHAFSVRATDDLGNGPGPTARREWRVDRSQPAPSGLTIWQPAATPSPGATHQPSPSPGSASEPGPAGEPLHLALPARTTRAALIRGLRLRVAGLRRGQRVGITVRAHGAVVLRSTHIASGWRLTVRLGLPRAVLRRLGAARLRVRAIVSEQGFRRTMRGAVRVRRRQAGALGRSCSCG
jgi:outer membrane protein assembly factor BamB